MLREGEAADFHKKEKDHRRGVFPAINIGVTHGKGTPHPIQLSAGTHSAMMRRLLEDADMQRLAFFASASFQHWFPRTYAYYKQRLDVLWTEFTKREEGRLLKKNFPRSIFPSAAFNFGPRVCTFKHRDYLNCPFGLCSVQALGEFDPKKGGHLVLWEPKIFIEFPANSVVLIPSATITHSNTPCQPHETRLSFTQYCAGGLFRFLKAQDPALYDQIIEQRKDQWKEGLELFGTLEELLHSS
ncbi:hypothetical protein BDN72DRAFT_867771 [Pluteus cervinus]|uniref:Uncharacterized protein n=1 Tax=Pluteus cervinus TaxID=181527 RepID=A0ACD3BDG6_9AGAR|nr:hypothetical protein BDN72DRAFT_867771 [Pluteus cervinus]